MSILEVNNIHKGFQEHFYSKPVEVLKGVSFALEQGSMTGFLGPNGAGKTTLIKVILGFISASQGSVVWDTKFGSSIKEINRYIGYFPERPYFYPNITGEEFLRYLGRLSSIPTTILKERIVEFSKMLDIEQALGRKISKYSKGMLQRLGFISAIIHDPEFLLFDEPLSGLDPHGRQEFKDVLIHLHKQGKTIFFSSHIVPDVEEVCENILLLDQGKILEHCPIAELLEKHEQDSFRLRFRKDGIENIKFFSSYEEGISFLEESKSQFVELQKVRPRLEEIIYKG